MSRSLRSLSDLAFDNLPPEQFIRTQHYLARARERGFDERLLSPILATGERAWHEDERGLMCAVEASLASRGNWRIILRLAEPAASAPLTWILVTVIFRGA